MLVLLLNTSTSVYDRETTTDLIESKHIQWGYNKKKLSFFLPLFDQNEFNYYVCILSMGRINYVPVYVVYSRMLLSK